MDLKEHFVVGTFCVVILVRISLSEIFELTSAPSVIGIVGQDAILPCQISLGAQPQNMEVQWKKIGSDHFGNFYQFIALTGQETFGQGYQGRAVLPKDGIATGNVSLILKKVQVTDDGIYSCVIKSSRWSADTQTNLHIAALGNVSVEVLGPEGDGIKLACRAAGWFPKPELQWVANPSQQSESRQDQEHLFSVSSNITALRGTGEITCSVHERSHLQMKKEFTILLSRNMFPHTSPWLPAFWILFMLALLAMVVVVYCMYKGRQKDSQKKFREEEEKLIQESWVKTIESENQNLLRRFERAQAELDFRKARSYLVDIRLDAECKHPELEVSLDESSVHHKLMSPEVGAMPGVLIVVATERFDNGKQYWEVRVEDKPKWEVGVLTEGARNKLKEGTLEALQENEYWSLRKSNGKYDPLEADREIQKYTLKLQVIGIYLDREESTVSFYNVKGMKIIVKIPIHTDERPKLKLYPFFSPGLSGSGDNDKPLIICQDRDWDFPAQLQAQPIAPQEGWTEEKQVEILQLKRPLSI